MTTEIVSAVLFALGIGALGGALFGRIRRRRLALFALALLLWAGAATLFFGGPGSQSPATATPAPTAAAAQTLPSPTIESTPSAAPSPTPIPTSTPTPESESQALYGQLVFASARSGNLDIWVMDLASGETTQLTTDTANDVEPIWSPDGTRILFGSVRDRANEIHDLWIMNADGSDQRRLLDWPQSYEWGATFSPDGEWIAFTTTRDYNYEIYVMKADGSEEPINLTQRDSLESYPNWSPDGRWLAFVSDRDGGWDIWKMDVEACLAARLAGEEGETPACEAQKLTPDNPDDDFFPRWSPDSARIAFESRRQATRDIYIMDADGGNVTRVTNEPARDTTPIWALDGKALIFSAERNYDWNFYLIRPDNGEEVQLTDFAGEDRFGDWRP
ncbi:MAG: TolB family protein [Chloroflexi bacterium]|nr:TolB family protein [Chloroflexota bacterium]